MTKERIRILVDTSRDSGWSGGLVRIEPDSIYQTTNNRDYLSRGEVTSPLQKNYDVLTICCNTSLKYTDAELQLIREFVENGGGLLLAASTSQFERDVREPISELGVNQVASLFDALFLPLPEGQGEMDTDANPLRSYTKKTSASLTTKLSMHWELMTWVSHIAVSLISPRRVAFSLNTVRRVHPLGYVSILDQDAFC